MMSLSFVLIGGHRHSEFNNMDIGNIGGNEENSNMDSEDLVPSLQVNVIAAGLHVVYSNILLSMIITEYQWLVLSKTHIWTH